MLIRVFRRGNDEQHLISFGKVAELFKFTVLCFIRCIVKRWCFYEQDVCGLKQHLIVDLQVFQ